MQTKVNTSSGSTTKTIADAQLVDAAGSAALALNFLSCLQETHEQAHCLALSAVHYLKAQKEEPDCFVVNFLQVISHLLESTKPYKDIEGYLLPIQNGGAK